MDGIKVSFKKDGPSVEISWPVVLMIAALIVYAVQLIINLVQGLV